MFYEDIHPLPCLPFDVPACIHCTAINGNPTVGIMKTPTVENGYDKRKADKRRGLMYRNRALVRFLVRFRRTTYFEGM
jgi:hypothetical protein